MSIKVIQQENKVKPGHVTLKVKKTTSVNSDDFARHVSGSSTLTKGEVKAVLTELRQFIASSLAIGSNVDLEQLGIWSVSVPGSWPVDRQEPLRLTSGKTPVKVHFKSKPRLNKEVTSRADFTDEGRNVREPVLSHASDPAVGKGSIYRAGGVVMLRGRDMKFDQADPQQGVFLTDSQGDQMRVDYYVQQSNCMALFVVPGELAGNGPLRVDIRVKYRRHNSSVTTELRKARLNRTLTEAHW